MDLESISTIPSSDLPKISFNRLRYREAKEIDQEARKQVSELAKELKRKYGLEIFFGPELKFQYRNNAKNLSFKEAIELFPKLESQPKINEEYDQYKELIFKKTKANKFIDILSQIKNFFLKLVKKSSKAIKVSFNSKLKNAVKMHPHLHINFSLYNEKNENLFKVKYRKLINYIANRLIEDLKDAFHVFVLGKGAINRYKMNGKQAPAYFSFKYGCHHSKAICIKDLGNNDWGRAELRIAESAGIDSLQTLFVISSVNRSIEKLIRRFGQPQSKEDIFDHLNKNLHKHELSKNRTKNSKDLKLPGTRAVAYKRFIATNSRKKLVEIFGERIYNLLTSAA